ncbi:hypothetical protein HKI87_01g03880 [Chloropicon roscoffensis]|uniref:F-box domain-containing protein n=1 Tax=Chloropicon roscoffensis TaxID=1461544 RepID=A0AAX4NZ69_9CHLO
MVAGTGEPSSKRAKVDKAKEEEDPLVRRREELALSFANTWAKGKELGARLVREAEEERWSTGWTSEGIRLVREARERAILESDRAFREAISSFGQELRSVCADLEAKNEKLLRRLPPELWQKIFDNNLHQNDELATAMTCRFFRDTMKSLGKKIETNLTMDRFTELQKSGKMASHSLGWFRWVCDTMEILPGYLWGDDRKKGAVYDGHMLNYAVFQGSVEILKWMEEKYKWEPWPDDRTEWYVGNEQTGFWAGWSGSFKVFEYLKEMGYMLTSDACTGAVMGGHLELLKFLRGMGTPCLWPWCCTWAAKGGHLEVLKWLSTQSYHWSRSDCRDAALEYGHQHVIEWIDQPEDDSEVEYRESSDSGSDDGYSDE